MPPPCAGSASDAGGAFTVTGGGNDIWADADQFQFVHQTLTGDGEIVARVTGQTATDAWAKSRRDDQTIHHRRLALRTTGRHPRQRRALPVQLQRRRGGPAATPNTWLKLKRTGDTITSFTSDGRPDLEPGRIGHQSTYPAMREIGLFVTSHNGAQPSTATFDNVQVTKAVVTPALPTPWTGNDVGAPALAGTASASAGTFTVTGGGNDIWADADQFQFVHQTLTGDGSDHRASHQPERHRRVVQSRVMIKQSTTAGSPYALLAVTPGNGVASNTASTAASACPGSHPPGSNWSRAGQT